MGDVGCLKARVERNGVGQSGSGNRKPMNRRSEKWDRPKERKEYGSELGRETDVLVTRKVENSYSR